MYENQTLETIAAKIVECATQADDHIIEAAMLIREAQKRVKKGEAGRTTWTSWAAKHINLGESRRRELQRIANAKDPLAELERIRSGNRERAANFRARSDGLISNPDPEDRRYVTSAQPDGSDRGSDQDPTAQSARRREGRPKRSAAGQRMKFVDIGKTLVAKKPSIASFEKTPETPSEVGLVVLLARVDLNSRTCVKNFITNKTVLASALCVIGNAGTSKLLEDEISSVSAKRMNAISNAIKEACSDGASSDLAAV